MYVCGSPAGGGGAESGKPARQAKSTASVCVGYIGRPALDLQPQLKFFHPDRIDLNVFVTKGWKWADLSVSEPVFGDRERLCVFAQS